MAGFIPAGWYPAAVVATDEGRLRRQRQGRRLADARPKARRAGTSHGHRGTVDAGRAARRRDPGASTREQVRADARVPQVLRAREKARSGVKPVPVPARAGEPSVFEHVVYVIKENRTYDQVFGDIKEGNGDPKLCLFPEAVTPNHHALAERVRAAGQLLLQRRPVRRRPRLGDRGQRHRPPGEGRSAASPAATPSATTRSPTPRPASCGTTPCCAACRSATTARWPTPSRPAKADFTAIYRDFTTKANKVRITQKYQPADPGALQPPRTTPAGT